MDTKERPILFSAPMVRAILDGSKTQTRRIFKGTTEHKGPYNLDYMEAHRQASGWGRICPYGAPGDRLWVRETWAPWSDGLGCADESSWVLYRADTTRPEPNRWRAPMAMPREASRILLEITDVRVQRLQYISDDDARAEGYDRSHAFPREWFALLWESINGDGSWNANPWVWAITFRRLQP